MVQRNSSTTKMAYIKAHTIYIYSDRICSGTHCGKRLSKMSYSD